MVDALPIQRKQGPKWRPNKCTFIATCSLSRASPSGRRASTKLHPALECHGACEASFGTFCSGVPRAKPPKGTWRPAKKRKTTTGASCWTQAVVVKKNTTLQVRIAHAQPRSIWSEVDRPAKGPGAHPDLPGKSAAKPRYTQDRGPKGVSKGTLPRLCWEASAFGNLLAHPGA